jgi:hypothetical protein
MEKIKKEYQETQAPIDQTGTPSLQTLKNVEQEVAQMLEASRENIRLSEVAFPSTGTG